jgi:hypothetical protein
MAVTACESPSGAPAKRRLGADFSNSSGILSLHYEIRMNKAIGPQVVHELLNADSSLSRLRRAAVRHEASAELKALLPPAIAQRLTLVRGDERLDVLADNNAVAQLARFHAPTLEKHAGLPVKVRVCPRLNLESATGNESAPVLPAEGASSLRDAADGIDDERLAGALRRLAARAETE